MAIIFQRRLALPVWALAVGAVGLSTLPGVMRSVIALVGIAAVGGLMPACARWLRTRRSLVEVLPAVDHDSALPAGILITGSTRTRTLEEGIDARTQKADDAADLVRMDDDGGRTS